MEVAGKIYTNVEEKASHGPKMVNLFEDSGQKQLFLFYFIFLNFPSVPLRIFCCVFLSEIFGDFYAENCMYLPLLAVVTKIPHQLMGKESPREIEWRKTSNES